MSNGDVIMWRYYTDYFKRMQTLNETYARKVLSKKVRPLRQIDLKKNIRNLIIKYNTGRGPLSSMRCSFLTPRVVRLRVNYDRLFTCVNNVKNNVNEDNA